MPAQNIQPFNLTINAEEELTSPDGTTISAIKQHNQPLSCPIHLGKTVNSKE